MSAKFKNSLATFCLYLAGGLIFAILLSFLGYILYKGLPVLSFDFILGKPSDIEAGGGVGPQLFNSFYILLLSMLVSKSTLLSLFFSILIFSLPSIFSAYSNNVVTSL